MPDAFLIGAVVIGVSLVARSLGCIDPKIDDVARKAGVLNRKRAVLAAQPGVIRSVPCLGAFETGQNIVPGPARAAKLRPVIVILRLPAHIEQTVD